MPRTSRAAVGGQCYHLINRGNCRAQIFYDRGDYRRFLALMREAQARVAIEVFACCLMPNHFHLLARARMGSDFAEWMHWLLTTHVRRHHVFNGSSGRLWQGRFKSFPIQEDGQFLTVARYVERNAVRAGLVRCAEEWPWGSLNWRHDPQCPFPLASSPVPLPGNWTEFVNAPQTPEELEAVRVCVNRQRPYGTSAWTAQTASQFGLSSSLRPVGRPRKNA